MKKKVRIKKKKNKKDTSLVLTSQQKKKKLNGKMLGISIKGWSVYPIKSWSWDWKPFLTLNEFSNEALQTEICRQVFYVFGMGRWRGNKVLKKTLLKSS